MQGARNVVAALVFECTYNQGNCDLVCAPLRCAPLDAPEFVALDGALHDRNGGGVEAFVGRARLDGILQRAALPPLSLDATASGGSTAERMTDGCPTSQA